jgi:hypothetical protein
MKGRSMVAGDGIMAKLPVFGMINGVVLSP